MPSRQRPVDSLNSQNVHFLCSAAARRARVAPRRLAKLTGYRVHLNRGLMSGASGGVTSGESSRFFLGTSQRKKNKCASRAEQEPTDNAELIDVASNSPSAS